MTQSDPIADMLTRIRNALMAGHSSVSIPNSTVKVAIAGILQQEGYIEDFEVADDEKFSVLRIGLKYYGDRRNRKPVISKLERVSKPGRRVYEGTDSIPWVRSGMGIVIMTTPRGVMTGQDARRKRVGGEVLCRVW